MCEQYSWYDETVGVQGQSLSMLKSSIRFNYMNGRIAIVLR